MSAKHLIRLFRLSAIAATIFIAENTMAQNVGINTTTPSEPLDVNGNINVAGTIKANGVDGAPNQVLMKNSGGVLAWGDLCDYKNYFSVAVAGNGTWTAPAGVTKVMIEVWGAGGGGSNFGGGGAGGYVRVDAPVTTGLTLNYSVGVAGSLAVNGTANSGGTSFVNWTGNSVSASGGAGATFSNSTTGGVGTGGSYSSSGSLSVIGFRGGAGTASMRDFKQYNATTWYEIGRGGFGGVAPQTTNAGAPGPYYILNTTSTTIINYINGSSDGVRPGGGGCGGVTYFSTSVSGGNGAPGMVIIHY